VRIKQRCDRIDHDTSAVMTVLKLGKQPAGTFLHDPRLVVPWMVIP
jgi:hypothetical protein